MNSRYRSVAGVSTCTSGRGKHGGSEELNEAYWNGAFRQARATELVDWLQRCGRLSRSWPSGVVTSGGTPIGPSPPGPVKTELVRNVGSALDAEDSALVGSTGQRPVLPASRIGPVVREGGRELIVERRGEWVSLGKNKECGLGRSRQTPSVRGVAEPRRDGPLALIQFFYSPLDYQIDVSGMTGPSGTRYPHLSEIAYSGFVDCRWLWQ